MKSVVNAFLVLSFFVVVPLYGQQQDRFVQLERSLKDLSSQVPGLNEKVDISVSGVSIQEFLRGLAESNNLNISVDPNISVRIYNNFTNEKVYNIMLFLAKEYDLDIRFIGTIMSFHKYVAPLEKAAPIPPKEIVAKYNSYTNNLTLDLRNDTLEKVVKKITQISKKNVIHSSGLASKIISVYIEEMPFDNALQKMAYANNLKVIKTDDDFYVIKSLEEGEDILAGATQKGKQKSKNPQNNKQPYKQGTNPQSGNLFLDIEEDTLGRKFINLEANNMAISEVLKAVAEEVDASYFLFSEVKGNTTTSINHVQFNDFLSYLLQGTDYTYKKDQNLYLIGERKLEGLRAHKVVQFQYRSLDAIQETIPAELKKGVEIKEFKELNSILLSGSLPQILEIESFVKQLDKVVPMVMIEVILMDIRKGKTVKTGISAGIDSTRRAGGTLLPGLDFTLSSRSINEFLAWLGTNNAFNIGRVTPNFYVSLSALENNNNVEVRSTPKLSTLNGHDANLSIGSTRYYSIRTQNVLGSLTPQTVVTEQFNAVNANLSVNIKPVVSGDDQVTLNIDVSITDFIGDPPPNAPPPSATSQFKSILRVKNEEMVVLGGLERNEKSDQGSGVPILSRIPVIKWLFSSRTRSRSKLISVVFIKPTIIY
ncbi:MAG: type II secretion system protein GspD [Cytophagaceae bacterium]